MGKNTILHVNVPNAFSMHRLIAKGMGIINDVHSMSEKNVMFQQAKVYDMESFVELIESVGMKVREKGSYFVKPFTHDQMFRMLEEKIIDEKVLDGLYAASKYWEGYGSEIFINAEKS